MTQKGEAVGMVAKVAMALIEELSPSCGDERCTCSSRRERLECITGTTAEELARAAIEAMREPDGSMVMAAQKTPNSAYLIWKAMVRAALKETP